LDFPVLFNFILVLNCELTHGSGWRVKLWKYYGWLRKK
jgi:hypothetical protein